MKYHYEVGATRWFRWTGGRDMDIRGYRTKKGWAADAMMLDVHPITGKPLQRSQWWIKETYDGNE